MTVFAVEYRYVSAPDEAVSRLDEVRPTHRAWLRERADSGDLLASGPIGDGTKALLIFRAADRAALDALLAQDPFQKASLVAETNAPEWNPIIGRLADAATV
ncbi:YciI family protein [Sinomonas sp. ASV486]|uniref:YciI family protein n=1 Tax=Sinomonas sp. ASV486 TaxID=3051170 RepID=UPI0027DB3292|nr:YciI family protein [Sinomonas sp. ASV486]MDQ4490479.1 YciI family protein [Sinomonas sp. ASV486]